MRTFLLAFIGFVLLSDAAGAANLTQRAFTETVAEAARTAMPSAKVSVTDNLQIQIEYGPGRGTASISLANAYDLYLNDPQRLKQVIGVYVEGMLLPVRNAMANPVDRSRIVPVVKNRQWFDHVQRVYRADGKELQYSEGPFADELIVVFAEDNSSAMKFLSSADDVGDRGQLSDLALANLIRLLPRIEMRAGADNTWLISAGGDYESSLLLLDNLWSGRQIKVEGEIVVAVPAKDALLVTGSRNRAGIARLRKFAADFVDGAFGLTKTLFVHRGGKFIGLKDE